MFIAHNIRTPSHWLFLWSLFEGVPKFYRDCFEQGALKPVAGYRRDTLRKLFFEGSSPLRDEATNWFLRELRGRYDSVLKLLARKGPCSYHDLVAEYAQAGSGGDKQLSAYLHALIDKYQMVEKQNPVFAPDRSRKARYAIVDNFLAAWLYALARAVQFARVQPVGVAAARADLALMTLEGHTFERMVRQLTEECSRKDVGDFRLTDLVKGYWNKADGSDIEIDLVAYDEEAGRVRLGSCKRSAAGHDAASLKKFEGHIERFLATKEGRRLSNAAVEKVLYCTAFDAGQRKRLESRGYICRDLNDFASYLLPAAI
jgi:hypothetical protein